jgi:hypothetical protein
MAISRKTVISRREDIGQEEGGGELEEEFYVSGSKAANHRYYSRG